MTASAQPDRRPAKEDVPAVEVLLAAAVSGIGGRPRPGQQRMADEVAAAFADESVLLVQAGTGTGKSLAYLVGAVRFAAETGRPVVISTATLALQAQIVARDLPRLTRSLRPVLGRDLTFQMVKGRSNYVCRQKLSGTIPDDEDPVLDLGPLPGRVLTTPTTSSLGSQVVRLREWAADTDTGDRDELVPGVSDRAWRQVSVSARECLGAQRCSMAAECFSELARGRAHHVDVVVTNHALLAIDTFENRSILPEHAALVVDEAHELADRVTSVVTDELTVAQVEAAAAKARRHTGIDAGKMLDAAADLAAAVESLPAGRFDGSLPGQLSTALAVTRDATRAALSETKVAGVGRSSSDSAATQVARVALTEVFDTVERLLADDDREVRWLSVAQGRGGHRRSLHVAPLGVAGRLRERLYEGRAVVLTSATLTIGGGFDAVARSVGLTGDTAPGYTGVDVGSPFDYRRQAILYVARDLPPPGRQGPAPQALDELAELIEAAGGRTLGLFSSRSAAEVCAEAIRDRADLPVLCQGDDTLATLVRQFADDPRACLFGTLSLWQGVDVPGPSCHLVVIDRIPFPRPDDPLLSARAQAVTKAGGNGFMSVFVQHAALRLAQGAGRLIRSLDDRGVVAVLDPRLVTARYGGYLVASLPPMWRTVDAGLVRAALGRLDRIQSPSAS